MRQVGEWWSTREGLEVGVLQLNGIAIVLLSGGVEQEKGGSLRATVEDEADTPGVGAALDEDNGLRWERGHAGREKGGGGLAGGRAVEGKFFICSFLT